MENFTFEEMNLMCIYNTGSRTGLMEVLTEMRGYLILLMKNARQCLANCPGLITVNF